MIKTSHIIESDSGRMKVLSPAKINLFLQVTGKRPDGYHNLISLMCPVSLYDTVSLEFDKSRIKVSCAHTDVPEDESNLAWQAADLFFKEAGISGGVFINIEKNIPVAGGAGGGSSNAASVLMALNHYYGGRFSKNMLMEMGLSLGADIPFFIFQKPAIAEGIGERLEFYQGIPNYYLILTAFDFKVSTANVYKKLNLGLTKCKKKNKGLAFKKQGFDVAQNLCNDLETVTASTYPEIITAKKALLDQGAEGALMSGSGPTVFGLFSDLHRAGKAKLSLSRNKRWMLYLVNLIV